MADSMQATPVDNKLALYLSAFLRGAREGGNVKKIPDWVPLMGGTGLGDLLVGKAPEGAERVAYGEPLTKGAGWTTQPRDEAVDLLMLGAGAAGPAKAGAKLAKKGAEKVGAAIAENALQPMTRTAAQRGAVDLGEQLVTDAGTKQGALFEPRTRREVAKQKLLNADRARVTAAEAVDESEAARRARNEQSGNDYRQPDPELAAQAADARSTVDAARQKVRGLAAVDDYRRDFVEPIERLRAGRSPTEGLAESLRREQDLLNLKATRPLDLGEHGPMSRTNGQGFDIPVLGRYGVYGEDLPENASAAIRTNSNALREQRELVRQLRDADNAVNPPEEFIRPPSWAEQLTDVPTAGGANVPADLDWWKRATGADPMAPEGSVKAFLEGARENPEALLQYGGMPGPEVQSLEDFAEHFGDIGGKRIRVDRGYWDPQYYKQEVEKEHGRHEVMRDRYGDYIMGQKEHEPGDFPMYDERGDVKKVEAKGPTQDEEPLMVKQVAEGGEPLRDDYGDVQDFFKKSEGGEPVYDERGNRKYTKEKVEDEDYQGDETVALRGPRGEITISDFGGSDPEVYAMNADGDGALLYQTLLAHASREGLQYPANSSLTSANQLRLLSNALPNWIRSGTNPRSVSHTKSGARPRATGYAEGPEMWQAIAGETDARLGAHGRDPNALQFTGDGFTLKGEPATVDDIENQLEALTNVGQTNVGKKTLMQNAVFKWLENATPEQAKKAAKEWREKIGAPLFGVAGATGLAQALRESQPQTD